MITITKERLLKIQQWRETYGPGSNVVLPAEEAEALARITLASLEAEPVAYVDPFAFHNFSVYRAGETDNKRMGREWMWANPDAGLIPVYTSPPEPVTINAEPVAWLWSHRKHPSEVTLVRPEDDERAEGAHWSGWSCQALYAAPPEPVSVPDDIDTRMKNAGMLSAAEIIAGQPIDAFMKHAGVVDLESLLKWAEMRRAEFLRMQAKYELGDNQKDDMYEWVTSHVAAFSELHVNIRAAMLQGAEPVTTAYKLRDAVDAIRNSGIAIDAEKILAERDALNAPDCWCRTCRPVTISDMRFVVCPECGNKRCPHANDHRHACTGSNEPGQEGSAYPAAPQQEAK